MCQLDDLAESFLTDVSVDLRRRQIRVTEQHFWNGPYFVNA